MKFFEVAAPSDSQDAPALKQSTFAILRKKLLELVLNKIVGVRWCFCKMRQRFPINWIIAGGFSLDFFYLVFQPLSKVDATRCVE